MAKLCFLEIAVSDLDIAIAWYQRVLELRPVEPMLVNEDGRWIRLRSDDGDELIALWEPSSQTPAATKAQSNIIPIFSVSDLKHEVKRMHALSVLMTEDIRDRGSYLITTIIDCSGNLLQLHESTNNV